jgi:hypothetical protein
MNLVKLQSHTENLYFIGMVCLVCGFFMGVMSYGIILALPVVTVAFICVSMYQDKINKPAEEFNSDEEFKEEPVSNSEKVSVKKKK